MGKTIEDLLMNSITQEAERNIKEKRASSTEAPISTPEVDTVEYEEHKKLAESLRKMAEEPDAEEMVSDLKETIQKIEREA